KFDNSKAIATYIDKNYADTPLVTTGLEGITVCAYLNQSYFSLFAKKEVSFWDWSTNYTREEQFNTDWANKLVKHLENRIGTVLFLIPIKLKNANVSGYRFKYLKYFGK